MHLPSPRARPSPSKEELKQRYKLLQREIESLKTKSQPKQLPLKIVDEKENIVFGDPKLVKCNQPGCVKSFVSVFGLEQHIKKRHAEVDKYDKPEQECPFCGKLTVYINQHIRSNHKEMNKNDICEV